MSDRLPWHQDPEYVAVCHEADMDGLGCALLLSACTAVVDVSFADYPLPPDLGAEGKVVVCDLRLPADSPAWQNPDLVVFDHHAAAPEGAKARYADARDDGAACATKLLWDYLVHQAHEPTDLTDGDRFVAMVNAGDLHLTDDPHYGRSRCYTWLLNKVGMQKLFAIARANPERFIDLPAGFLRTVDAARKRENEKARAVAEKFGIGRRYGDSIPYLVTLVIGGDRSEILGGMAEELGTPVVGLCLDQLKGRQVTASIRDPEGRAREIAEAFGGGGHREAAGFTMDLDEALRLWRCEGEYSTAGGDA